MGAGLRASAVADWLLRPRPSAFLIGIYAVYFIRDTFKSDNVEILGILWSSVMFFVETICNSISKMENKCVLCRHK